MGRKEEDLIKHAHMKFSNKKIIDIFFFFFCFSEGRVSIQSCQNTFSPMLKCHGLPFKICLRSFYKDADMCKVGQKRKKLWCSSVRAYSGCGLIYQVKCSCWFSQLLFLRINCVHLKPHREIFIIIEQHLLILLGTKTSSIS